MRYEHRWSIRQTIGPDLHDLHQCWCLSKYTYYSDAVRLRVSWWSYQPYSGTATVTITQVSSSVSIDCPASVEWTGATNALHRPCHRRRRSGSNHPSCGVTNGTYSNNTAVGTASVSYAYPGDTNHTGTPPANSTFEIIPPYPNCTITGYTVDYDGGPHMPPANAWMSAAAPWMDWIFPAPPIPTAAPMTTPGPLPPSAATIPTPAVRFRM